VTPRLSLDHVTKRFYLRSGTRRLAHLLPRLFGAFRRAPRQPFLAVRDVSFAVGRGETLGIIGANGSGKSTLLKVVAGIYPPTFGTIHREGRVIGLLELGAGFNGDLTGRENIFLNGSLLGCTTPYLRERLGAIIDFADMHDFIDTPLKHYSSGMKLRLGFAIAVHIEAEIMLMDEVFAVGDAQFQQKCLRQLERFQADGRTLLVVSHALDLIQRLCARTVWLHRGVVMEQGATAAVIASYEAFMRRLSG
jgi:ABC-type polysaccharide/polyol phosphate transport system ATPase subunit